MLFATINPLEGESPKLSNAADGARSFAGICARKPFTATTSTPKSEITESKASTPLALVYITSSALGYSRCVYLLRCCKERARKEMNQHILFVFFVWVSCSHAFCIPFALPNLNRTHGKTNHRSSRTRHQTPLRWFGRNNPRESRVVPVKSSVASDDSASTASPSTASASSSSAPESVHLRLNDQKEEDDQQQKPKKDANTPTTVKVHSYFDPASKTTWTSLNTTKRKFQSYLRYSGIAKRNPKIETRVVTDKQNDLRLEWRRLWQERRLVTDRTELLTVYPSETSNSTAAAGRRGGFADLLSLYTERLVAIWKDEQEEEPLVDWLVDHCPSTAALVPKAFGRLRSSEKLAALKTFLEWFRSEFPYFYDRCGVCGASIKEDGPRNEKKDDDEEEDDSQTFVGYIYPSETEVEGKASRTELYRCHKCHSFTRFPRYNSARYVLENRRGRCGEYSMLLYRFLRTLGHECRWVVDWADHVWAEIRVDNRWVHMDPCEAALDHNLLYQEWGKKQTFVLGFCLPSGARSFKYPLIEDITQRYTTDSKRDIANRRDEADSQVRKAIETAAVKLRSKLMQKQ